MKTATKLIAQLSIAFGIILIVMCIMPIASALTDADADYLIKQYSVFDIQRSCSYNLSICSPDAICNISLSSVQGNGSILYNNTPMTNIGGGNYILHLTGSDTKNAGYYKGIMYCEDLGDFGYDIFFLKISSTGDENNTSIFIIIGIAFVLIIACGYLIRNEYLVFIGGMTALISGVYGMIYGFSGVQNDFTRMLSLIVLGIGIIFTIMPAYSLVEQEGSTGYEEIEEVSIE